MSKFNQKTTTQTSNLAGGQAYSMKPAEELVHAVLTTFLEDKYYESSEERLSRLLDFIAQAERGESLIQYIQNYETIP